MKYFVIQRRINKALIVWERINGLEEEQFKTNVSLNDAHTHCIDHARCWINEERLRSMFHNYSFWDYSIEISVNRCQKIHRVVWNGL